MTPRYILHTAYFPRQSINAYQYKYLLIDFGIFGTGSHTDCLGFIDRPRHKQSSLSLLKQTKMSINIIVFINSNNTSKHCRTAWHGKIVPVSRRSQASLKRYGVAAYHFLCKKNKYLGIWLTAAAWLDLNSQPAI